MKNAVRDLRQERGWSQGELAEKLGRSSRRSSAWSPSCISLTRILPLMIVLWALGQALARRRYA